MTALRMAESGECRRMMFSAFNCGYVAANAAGIMAKYFATSLTMLKVVSEPRSHQHLFASNVHYLDQLGRVESNPPYCPSFAAQVPEFIATATSACASAGASLVPSPVIAAKRPFRLILTNQCQLGSGVASARKSSTPASAAIAAAVRHRR